LTDLDDYTKANLAANKAKDNRIKKFTANDPYYANIAPVSDIDKGMDLATKEFEEIVPISEEKRVDICKPVDPDLVLVQTLKRWAQCKRIGCQYKWLTKSTRAYVVCPRCYSSVKLRYL
jgi:hypothetical protein